MWKRRDVDPQKTYCVLLCQQGRRRYFSLCEIDRDDEEVNMVFKTHEVPQKLLLKGDSEAISEAVSLTNGKRFFVNAHGMWLTEEEANAFSKALFDQIPWHNGIVPERAPI